MTIPNWKICCGQLLTKRQVISFSFLFLWSFIIITLSAQTPVIKVDLNKGDRQESEVNEPGYTPWPIVNGNSISHTFEGVEITFTRVGPFGTGLKSDWYKAGIQAPIYARLANDGLTVEDGDDGGQIEMRISGLLAGTHTLLTYHNTYANPLNNTFSPVDVYLNDTLVADDLMPTNRVTSNDDMTVLYQYIEAQTGVDIVLLFAAETTSTASSKNVTISGFEFNTQNPKSMARRPAPADGDEHADADTGHIQLRWKSGLAIVSQDIYFGTDAEALALADHSSPEYKGNQTDTTYAVGGLYSMLSYFWRIDGIDTSGSTITGNVWYFRPRQLAFHGAEGYGRFARGGRGGTIVEVTNLDDAGPGSLREAVTSDIGPRTIVFTVSGVITLNSRLTLNNDYVTVAGQTAPGKGICIRKAPFGLSGAKDIVVRNVRVRLGSGTTYDGMGMQGSDHCIIDHSSISWTIDEGFSSRDAKNITLQRTLISEALNIAGHSNYPPGTPHGFAGSISGDKGSFHHNLLAHCFARNWSLAGGLDANAYYAGRLDIFNNVVYNWTARTTEGGAHEVNFVNNYYKPGPALNDTAIHALMAEHDTDFPGTQRYFFNGNVMPGYFDETNQEDGRILYGPPFSVSPWVNEPFFPSYAEIHTAEEAYKSVLSDVGCTQPVFDEHDVRIIMETSAGSYTYTGSVGELPGIPDSEADVGGWEVYPMVNRPANWDSDHDGLPNWWEILHNLDTNSASGDFSDANADIDLDGFTNLDDYLDWMALPHFTTGYNQSVFVDMAQLSRGYINYPSYTITEYTDCTADILGSSHWVQFTPGEPGLASFRFTVTDAVGSSMVRTVGVHVSVKEMVELDSLITFVTTDTTFVHDNDNPVSEDLPILCYPNPATNDIVLSLFMKESTMAYIIVRNIVGKPLIDRHYLLYNGGNLISIDISQWASGIYFLTVTGNNKQGTIKFVKK